MITVFDVLRDKIGDKDVYNGEDFDKAGLPMFGGCLHCHESLAAYNAYPTTTGFLMCHDCADGSETGFSTVEEYKDWDNEQKKSDEEAVEEYEKELEDEKDN